MIRILSFMALLAMGMLIASCGPTICIAPLGPTVRETLTLVKKEINRTILLTEEKIQHNEVDFQVGNKINDSLTATIKQLDTLFAVSLRIDKTGNKEDILNFAERTGEVIQSELTTLKSLLDLYDISTYSQFEAATIFPADSYSTPAEKTGETKKALEPVAQRIVRFFNDHPRQKFETVITCSSTLAGQEPNDSVCEKMARSVANLLLDQIRSKEEFIPKPEWIHYQIKWAAKRGKLPYTGKSKFHQPEDKHRNMVSLTWNMLPALLYTD